VPFAILKDGRGRYLVADFEISYLNAGRDMLRAPDRFVSRAPVVVAGLAYSSTSDRGTRVALGVPQPQSRDGSDQDRIRRQWTEIPGSLKEGLAVSSLLHVGVLSGASGTKAAVQQIRNPAVLHFATHGFFDRSPVRLSTGNARLTDALLRSGIVLAGANDADEQAAPNNAILTALEAASLDLRGTQMVTLSGCDTGLGISIQGEGVYGLRRAFMAAGARAVMMTLWRTQDRSTTFFMADFYRRLARGASKPAALRAAQLAMIRTAEFREPHYWGSFILAGDPSPLSLPIRY
jgi:CHAT domain-containing protein